MKKKLSTIRLRCPIRSAHWRKRADYNSIAATLKAFYKERFFWYRHLHMAPDFCSADNKIYRHFLAKSHAIVEACCLLTNKGYDLKMIYAVLNQAVRNNNICVMPEILKLSSCEVICETIHKEDSINRLKRKLGLTEMRSTSDSRIRLIQINSNWEL
jgi:hypothetical protein